MNLFFGPSNALSPENKLGNVEGRRRVELEGDNPIELSIYHDRVDINDPWLMLGEPLVLTREEAIQAAKAVLVAYGVPFCNRVKTGNLTEGTR